MSRRLKESIVWSHCDLNDSNFGTFFCKIIFFRSYFFVPRERDLIVRFLKKYNFIKRFEGRRKKLWKENFLPSGLKFRRGSFRRKESSNCIYQLEKKDDSNISIRIEKKKEDKDNNLLYEFVTIFYSLNKRSLREETLPLLKYKVPWEIIFTKLSG